MGVEAGLGGSQVYPTGNLGYKGTSLDVKSDLNLGRANTVIGRVRLEVPLIIPNIYIMARPMRFEGTQVRTQSFTYSDKTYSASLPYTTKLKLDHYDLTLFYGIPVLKTATAGILNIDLGLNVRYLDFKGEIIQPGTGQSESKSQAIPIPMVFAAVQVAPISLIAVEGELKAVGYGNNRYVDAIARVKVKPLPFLFIGGGYGFENIKIDQNDIKADLKLGGPIVELGVQF
ncbi:MAG: hypothetical protein A2901_06805 [Elusimicrobia bacterium RIFCSPLOWO2_01_FULL_54_10]|nr:MAG: hypothetical protein A2901_06805 [Elusimicrobia bacterium RIFCSPLOWO2_01_FULL_54_10]